MKKLLAALTVSLFAVTAAQAAELAEVDADSDGMVSWEEARSAMPDVTAEKFKAADTDGDGKLNAAEFAALQG